jgi:TrmH family RNA methyltransferase
LLVVESIEKPGNLGTILRSADAAGCDAVIVCDAVTDIFNPNVVRASTGVLFSVPIVVAESTAVHAWLKEKGIRTAATTPHTTNIYTADGSCAARLAIVMGSEQYGLSEFWMKGRGCARPHPDGRPSRLAQCRDGDDHHALRSRAAAEWMMVAASGHRA